ncbi:hypothetical protein ANN_15421 [Periplaneta americana]|uniref:Uncharacterized protein n=1 Tax=Periplaneta americana TaxID=6978 RepID=A0ABQ8SGC4_PERAM|nr:hypothetical protein ANN_15421 [Periplaneta americana]
MEEEVERVVINIGIVISDEECKEDEMDYDRPGRSTYTADEGSSTDSAVEIETSATGIHLLKFLLSDCPNISPADSPRIETERIAFATHKRPHLKTAMFHQTGYNCSFL